MIRKTTLSLGRQRPGFTLVELMVAAAICVIIMTVLATAFSIAIETMRQMKSAGEMADQLRATSEVMRRDLQSSFFLPEESKLNQGRTLSNQRFDLGDAPPLGGYFSVFSPAVQAEGFDPDGIASTVNNTTPIKGVSQLHTLQFTSLLPKLNGEQGLFTATLLTGQTFTSPAAELAYFLTPTGSVTVGSNVPLFNLIRRQRLAALTDDDAIALITIPQDCDVISSVPSPPINKNPPNTVRALTQPGARLSPNPAVNPGALGGARLGEDVLLSNVISFEIRLLWTIRPLPGVTPPRMFSLSNTNLTQGTLDIPSSFPNNNSDGPFDTLAGFNATSTFDTANPGPIRVRAIQIRIRVYDPKLMSARQITIVQNL